MRKLYVDIQNIHGKEAVIKDQDAKHLANVMRLSPGDVLEICDGQGRDFKTEIRTISSVSVTLDIIEELSYASESPAHIIFAQGMLKDKKMDMLVRHLTELGIAEWIPFFAERSVPKPNLKKIRQRRERWERIAREALNQCGRSVVPYIGMPVQFNELIQSYDDSYIQKIIFWEKSSCPIDVIRGKEPADKIKTDSVAGHNNHTPGKKIIILTGPEGGFTEDEIKFARRNGFKACSLGPRILRAETASIAACALVQNIFGDFGRKSS